MQTGVPVDQGIQGATSLQASGTNVEEPIEVSVRGKKTDIVVHLDPPTQQSQGVSTFKKMASLTARVSFMVT